VAKDKEKGEKKKKKPIVTQSLANKYRPQVLSELVGQDDAVRKIKGMLKSRKIPSAILLSGGTGCGKSTIARMLARYFNCDTMDACGTCKNCELSMQGIHPDFEEVNISSARGIDDIRSLIQRARNKPRYGNLRIVFADEVHQLTPQAAEAWLVPLETPAPQTLWILATTNPEKLPKTILNRVSPLTLQLIEKDLVVEHLKKIAKKEGIEIKKSKVFDQIAELTGGYMRNAVQVLEAVQQAINSGEKATTEMILETVKSAASEAADSKQDDAAIKMLVALYARSVKSLWKNSAPVNSDYVGFVNKMLWLNQFMLESIAIQRGPTVWYTPLNTRFKKTVQDAVKSKVLNIDIDKSVRLFASLQGALVSLRSEIVTVSGFDRPLILSRLSQWIESVKGD